MLYLLTDKQFFLSVPEIRANSSVLHKSTVASFVAKQENTTALYRMRVFLW